MKNRGEEVRGRGDVGGNWNNKELYILSSYLETRTYHYCFQYFAYLSSWLWPVLGLGSSRDWKNLQPALVLDEVTCSLIPRADCFVTEVANFLGFRSSPFPGHLLPPTT